MMEKAAVTLLLLAAAATAVTAAGMKEQQCAENMLPCSQFLNATSKPPEPCCRVLRSEVEDELPCLCAILNNSAILDAFNMSSARAFQFASDCGVTNTSVCASSGPTPPRAPLPLTPPGCNIKHTFKAVFNSTRAVVSNALVIPIQGRQDLEGLVTLWPRL